MSRPKTSANTPGQPGHVPGQPTPEDPRQNEPIRDPPLDPERDDVERLSPERRARLEDIEPGVEAPNPAPDQVVFDENRSHG